MPGWSLRGVDDSHSEIGWPGFESDLYHIISMPEPLHIMPTVDSSVLLKPTITTLHMDGE